MKTSSEMPPPHRAPAADRPSPGGAPRTSMRIIWIDLLLYPTHSLPTAAAPVPIFSWTSCTICSRLLGCTMAFLLAFRRGAFHG